MSRNSGSFRMSGQEDVMTDGSTQFRDAARSMTGVTASLEKRTLIWLAGKLPRGVNSDHLTLLALAAMCCAGVSYRLSRAAPAGLLLVNVCLVLNWFGDSLDGTLARVRRQQRPRYGFYVDHIVDAVGAVFLVAGMGMSGYMHPFVALGVLVAYLLLLVETFLATYTVGTFTMSYFKVGPTELRILLGTGNLVLLVHPMAGIFGRDYRLFDVGGVVAMACMAITLVYATARHTRMLYLAEPLDTTELPAFVAGAAVSATGK
jgi:archaetidylinositol phosphate synthase